MKIWIYVNMDYVNMEVWKQSNREIWKQEILKYRNMEIGKYGFM